MKWQTRFTSNKLLRQVTVTALLLASILGAFVAGPALRYAGPAASAHTQEGLKTLYFPRLQMGKGWKSSITLTNQEDREVTSTLKTFSVDGAQRDEIAVGKQLPRWRFRNDVSGQYDAAVLSLTQLAAGESKTVDLEALPIDSAAMIVEANGNVIGHVTIQAIDGNQVTDIPAVDELAMTLNFPCLTEDDITGKTLGVFNPGAYEALLEIIALNSEDREIARRRLPPLASNESRTLVPTELFEDVPLEQVVNVQLVSNVELAGVQVPKPTENDWFSAAAFKESRETTAKLAVAAAAPTTILSPVEGPLRVTSSNLAIKDGKWEFNQHKTGLHKVGGGIGGSNDTYAWDVNLYTSTNGNADAGMNVYAAAEGDVVTYAGVGLSNSCNAVLIAHPNKNAPEWWSGYLHLQSQNVTLNQHVTAQTVIGKVGRACATNDHLHFVVYTGQNKSGGLVSFNANIIERGTGPSYEGYHDRVDCNLIEGWAWDQNQPNTPINVDIYDGGSKIMTVLADRFRQDLVNAGKGNGYHGFSVATPASLKDGRSHTVYVKYGGTSNNLNTTGKTIACQSSAQANITSPANGSTFTSSTVTFYWDAGAGVSEYYLYVGNSQGANDIYGGSQGLSRSRTVSNLPTDGRTVYARLWSLINGDWQYNDYTYRAFSSGGGVKANITSPTPGSTFSSSTVNFTWDSGSGVSQYWLYIGSSQGGNDIYSQSQGTNRSVTVTGIPTDGRMIYVRLWSYLGNGWQSNDYTYRAYSNTAPVKAAITNPLNGSTLTSSSATFYWNSGVGVSEYFLYVGTCSGCNNIYGQSQGTSLSRTVSGIPTSGAVYVRLWSLINGGWQYNDYGYTARR